MKIIIIRKTRLGIDEREKKIFIKTPAHRHNFSDSIWSHIRAIISTWKVKTVNKKKEKKKKKQAEEEEGRLTNLYLHCK